MAGERFYNVLWDGRQVGSLVTIKKEPLQFYLKPETEAFDSLALPEGIVSHCGSSHYGVGETKVDLQKLVHTFPDDSKKIIEVLNKILGVTKEWLSGKKAVYDTPQN